MADGFNLVPGKTVDDTNVEEKDFVKMSLTISNRVLIDQDFSIRFRYNDLPSPPSIIPALTQINSNCNLPIPEDNGSYEYRIRLWNCSGTSARIPYDLASGGNYIVPSKIYTLGSFGIDNNTGRTASLWIEGLRPSISLGGEIITVEFDVDADGDWSNCYSDTVHVTVLDFQVRKGIDSSTTRALNIARWENGFVMTGTPPNQAVAPNPAYVIQDPARFYTFMNLFSPEVAWPPKIDICSYANGANPFTDTPIDTILDIVAVSNQQYTYDSGHQMMLVYNKDEVDDDFRTSFPVTWNNYDSFIDDDPFDQTIYAEPGGMIKCTVRFGNDLHDLQQYYLSKVCDQCAGGITENILRPHIMQYVVMAQPTPVLVSSVEVPEVEEDIDLMNKIWSQACLRFVTPGGIQVQCQPGPENFEDTGYDHDHNTATPLQGVGNGEFDFTDANEDRLHNPNEDAEWFWDGNGNNGYDFAVDLSNGLDSSDQFGQWDCIPTREERNLIDSLSDADPMTIEYFIVPYFVVTIGQPIRGEAFVPFEPRFRENLKHTNTFIVEADGVGVDEMGEPRAFAVSAHEAGHVLLNSGHVVDNELPGKVNLMAAGTDPDDTPIAAKRLTDDQCQTARNGPTPD